MTAARGAAALGGLGLAAVVAAVSGVPAADAVLLVALSFGVASVACAVGMAVMRRLDHRSVGAAAVVLSLVPVLSVACGALVAAEAMFVSVHDLSSLIVIVVGAGTAGVLSALGLAEQLVAARVEADAAAERQRVLEHSRRELVAWVSHDLRTPLAGVRAMLEALEDGVVADEATVRRYHRQIGEEVERLSRLVDDLFELSRIQTDALQLAVERISWGDLVSDALASAAVRAEAKDVRLCGRVDHLAPDVEVSAREVTRAVANLLDNAIRHTPAGGTVLVEVGHVDGSASVSVRDQCGGIPAPELRRIFEPAYRGDPARTPGEGTGLGLAIARGLVEAHRGAIDVRNEDDGCRFTVRIPTGSGTASAAS